MSDLEKYINPRKENDKSFAEGFDIGYENFKIGAMLKNARIEKGKTWIKLRNCTAYVMD
ncbi:MAG: hypothetical protein PQJ59_04240 [Spirochaetales bacterium]|nr:hypothetical protein [Spirochaetales bacterium]